MFAGFFLELRQAKVPVSLREYLTLLEAMRRLDEGNFFTAWGGIASLAVAVSAMWTGAAARGFGLEDLARWMSAVPALLAGCADKKGKLAAGFDADFFVFDDAAEFVVSPERLFQRHAISPYLGEKLRGAVKRTYLRGECVFGEGKILGVTRGREIGRL